MPYTRDQIFDDAMASAVAQGLVWNNLNGEERDKLVQAAQAELDKQELSQQLEDGTLPIIAPE